MNKKKISMIAMGLVLCTQLFPVNVAKVNAQTDLNYADAFSKSILFYEANWCGEDAGENRFPWRDACHVNDGADVGVDLTGGFHDCGDHVKFGITEAYTAATLGWSYYEFKDTFVEKGQDKYMLNILKHFTDYFLKSYPNNNTFYYQVGDGDTDHSYWGPPELQTTARPSKFAATPSTPASDVCGETSAALTLMYLNYKSVDASYADKCLEAAKNLYNLGKNNLGLSNGQSYYTSSDYWDDLAWAGVWLYQATGDNSYMDDIKYDLSKKNVSQYYEFNWTNCWDNVLGEVILKLAQLTGESQYKTIVEKNIDYWINKVPKTPGGLSVLSNWGTTRYTAAECMFALVYYKTSNDPKDLDFALGQINYILGDNSKNYSYMVGFGSNYPKFPHHRAASGRCEFAPLNEKKSQPEKNILYGALVGGPDMSDNYADDIEDYVHSEVGIDYNAGFVGALAGITKYYGANQSPEVIPGLKTSSFPALGGVIPPTVNVGDLNNDGKVNVLDYIKMRTYLVNNNFEIDKNIWDINNDGNINIFDRIALKKMMIQ
jgi:hypothetical protein